MGHRGLHAGGHGHHLLVREVSDDTLAPHSLREAVIDPFREFFSRDGIRAGLAILAFMFLYKLGDNMATALATPFYIDMGYSNYRDRFGGQGGRPVGQHRRRRAGRPGDAQDQHQPGAVAVWPGAAR